MSRSLSGKELAELGFSFTERELFFVVDHPEFKNFTPYLCGTYESCQAKELGKRIPELDEAYEHVFITDGGCNRCKMRFESLREPLARLLQDLQEEKPIKS